MKYQDLLAESLKANFAAVSNDLRNSLVSSIILVLLVARGVSSLKENIRIPNFGIEAPSIIAVCIAYAVIAYSGIHAVLSYERAVVVFHQLLYSVNSNSDSIEKKEHEKLLDALFTQPVFILSIATTYRRTLAIVPLLAVTYAYLKIFGLNPEGLHIYGLVLLPYMYLIMNMWVNFSDRWPILFFAKQSIFDRDSD